MFYDGMPLSDREKAERIEQLLFERIDVCVHISSSIIITRPQPKSNRSQCSPQHNRHRYARRPAAVYAHCKRTYRVKYKKQTLYANTFRHPKAHRICFIRKARWQRSKSAGREQTHPSRRKQKVARHQKYAIPKAHPSQRKQDDKKTNPDTLTDDKKHARHPQTNLYRQRHAPMRTEYPHLFNARRSKKIAYQSTVKKCFTKSVKQARKIIWTRRKTPLRARDRAVAYYGTLFANVCIICACLEIIWLDFDRSCPYCSL